MRWKFENGFQLLIAALVALLLWSARASAQSQTGAAIVEFSDPHFVAQINASVANVVLKRTGNTNAAVSVDLTTIDDTAVAGVHYTPKSGPVNFAAGQTEETISIPLLPGERDGQTKAAKLVLSNPARGAVLGPRSK